MIRLLRSDGDSRFSLKEFEEDGIPPYAILSHTWSIPNDDEVTLKDVIAKKYQNKKGFKKLRFCATQAAIDRIEYFWIDSCCIDRSNQVELQRSINCMFKWYQEATKCYVYLADVAAYTQSGDRISEDDTNIAFLNSRWFSRGWTLQELIAPKLVIFHTKEGTRLGDKMELEDKIVEKTGIPREALRGGQLDTFSVPQRLSWMGNRMTKEREDKAYCLSGIFGVVVTMRYGEGLAEAMGQLQEAIIKKESRSYTEHFEVYSRHEVGRLETLIHRNTQDEHAMVSPSTRLDFSPSPNHPLIETQSILSDTTGKSIHSRRSSTWGSLLKSNKDTSKEFDGIIHSATQGNKDELLEQLIKLASHSDKHTHILNQALLEASTNDKNNPQQSDIVKLLIDSGAEPEFQSKKTNRKYRKIETGTPLIWAISEGQRDIAETLIACGASLETRDNVSGATPLIWAVYHGHDDIVAVLLSRFCQLESKDSKKHQRTALHWAANRGNANAIRFILKTYAPDGRVSDEDQVRKTRLLELEDSQGMTALMLSVMGQNYDASKFLLLHGAEPNCTDSKGVSLLVWAVTHKDSAYVPYVKLLIENGGNANTKDKDNMPLLCLAAKAGYADIVKILLEDGKANIFATDRKGRTALYWANKSRYRDIERYLRLKSAASN